MKLEWSDQALADLDRFAEFLRRDHPSLGSSCWSHDNDQTCAAE
jgi:hypothetical protein